MKAMDSARISSQLFEVWKWYVLCSSMMVLPTTVRPAEDDGGLDTEIFNTTKIADKLLSLDFVEADWDEILDTCGPPPTSTNSCLCECPAPATPAWIGDVDETWDSLTFAEKLEKIERELKVDRSRTTINIRKKISAPDARPLAQGMGCLAVVILVIFVSGIVILDLSNLKRIACHKCYRNKGK